MEAKNYDLTPVQEFFKNSSYSPKEAKERLRGIQLNYSEAYIKLLEVVADSNETPDWYTGILESATGDMLFLKMLADSIDKIKEVQTV